MEGRGFEVVLRDKEGKVIVDRPVNHIRDGHGWAKVYVGEQSSEGSEATFYIDGKPQATYYNQNRKRT